MALPKLDVPIYELTLPSTDEPISYRPFLVKEEKILLMATEGKDTKEITTAIKQILNNCILTDEIKPDKLPLFDIEYILLNLRTFYLPIYFQGLCLERKYIFLIFYLWIF